MVNIVASYFFGGISGSAAADTASIGSIMIPMMVDQGYDADFSTAVTITSSCEGLLVPPATTWLSMPPLPAAFPWAPCSWRAICPALCWPLR